MNKTLSSLLLAVLLVVSRANAKTRPIKGSSSTSKRALAAAAAYHNHAHVVVPTHTRLLKKDEDKPEDDKPDKDEEEDDKEEPAMAAEDDKNNNKDDKNDPEMAGEETEPPMEGAIEGEIMENTEAPMMNITEETEAPVVVNGETEGTVEEEEETIGAEEKFNVTIDPFTLAVTGDVSAEDLMIEEYLMTMLAPEMDNLQNIYLDMVVTVGGEIVVELIEEEEGMNETATGEDPDLDSRRRSLRAIATAHKGRFLQGDEKVVYYQGDAEFMGPPKLDAEVVNEAVRTALSDQEKMNEWISTLFMAVAAEEAVVGGEEVAAPANVTVTFQPEEEIPDTVASAFEDMDSKSESNEGLSTTGLAIVIVAACVGGLSLLIIVFVGLTGPAGPGKSGLPESPRERQR